MVLLLLLVTLINYIKGQKQLQVFFSLRNLTPGIYELYVWEDKNSNLQSFITNLPEGLNTNIGEFGDKISGGQKQRIGIARAIFNNPKVLILDEFTSSLDIKNEKKILEEISHLKKDKIIIIISHKISTLSHCDRIFKIENQTLVQSN